MRTLRLRLRYDGTDFNGWQVQPDARTVQGEVELAVRQILDRPTRVIGAGRTDAGVHAVGQVASFVTENPLAPGPMRHALNAVLPPDVRVDRVEEAPEGFHARFSAIRRTYRYHIHRRSGPFRRRFTWLVPRAPGADELNVAMKPLIGRHPFFHFTAGEGLTGTARCDVQRLEWVERRDRLTMTITADRFLYRMVRYLVGVAIGLHRNGALSAEAMARTLAPAAPRPVYGAAPPQGLFFARVDYPPDGALRPYRGGEAALESPDEED